MNDGLVEVAVDPITLEGNLLVPARATGIVVFAHGSGSSRFSSRNRFVASELRRAGLGTLLIDLLTADEERRDLVTSEYRFHIGLLADRVAGAVEWLRGQREYGHLQTGVFGASTGGGAALAAAASLPNEIHAVVSRGGRPDLAGDALPGVKAPTLLIVGGNDKPVIELNREAFEQMTCERRMEVVPGASHLFEEAGALEHVARLAADWFQQHLH